MTNEKPRVSPVTIEEYKGALPGMYNGEHDIILTNELFCEVLSKLEKMERRQSQSVIGKCSVFVIERSKVRGRIQYGRQGDICHDDGKPDDWQTLEVVCGDIEDAMDRFQYHCDQIDGGKE